MTGSSLPLCAVAFFLGEGKRTFAAAFDNYEVASWNRGLVSLQLTSAGHTTFFPYNTMRGCYFIYPPRGGEGKF